MKKLKAGAFFSGMIPGLDIGMEYYYKYLFKEKLKSLYGFDCVQSGKVSKKEKEKIDKIDNNCDKENTNSLEISDFNSINIDERANIIENEKINKFNDKKEKKNFNLMMMKKQKMVLKIQAQLLGVC